MTSGNIPSDYCDNHSSENNENNESVKKANDKTYEFRNLLINKINELTEKNKKIAEEEENKRIHIVKGMIINSTNINSYEINSDDAKDYRIPTTNIIKYLKEKEGIQLDVSKYNNTYTITFKILDI